MDCSWLRRPTFLRLRRAGERGATLTGYALTMATFAAVVATASIQLEDSSGEFLTEAGSTIGEPRPAVWNDGTILRPPAVPFTWASTTTTVATTSTTTASSTTAAPTTTTTAAPTTTVPISYTVVYDDELAVAHSDLCLYTDGSGVVRQGDCNGQTVQMGQRPDNGTVVVTIDGQCLAPTGSAQGDQIVAVTCDQDDTLQQWNRVGDSLINESTGMCMDVRGASSNSGQDLIQWGCHGGDNQNFVSPDPEPEPDPILTFTDIQVRADNGKCIGQNNNGWLRTENCNDGSDQRITATDNGDGTIRLDSNGSCFGAYSNSPIWVDAFGCDGGDDQKFVPVETPGGSVMFESIGYPGQCLTYVSGYSSRWLSLRPCNDPSNPGDQAWGI